jgi:hypothetical protein
MKYLLTLLSLLLLSFTSSDKVEERLGVKGPLTFNDTKFNLIWSDKPSDIYYIQEYLPDGEKVESFNEMLTIHFFDVDVKLENVVQQKIQELLTRKKTDPVCNYQVTESPDGKEFIVDFLLGESKGDKMSIVEFNIYRYKQIEFGRKGKGIIVYAYSKRSYGDSITSFFQTLGGERVKYLNEMISAEVPRVELQDK